jgi:hypothetical protein
MAVYNVIQRHDWKRRVKDIIPDIVAVLAGCALLTFRKPFARLSVKCQNELWGFHFGEPTVRISEGVIPFLVEIEVWLPPWDNPRDDIS